MIEEFAEFLVDDPNVGVVSIYLEGIKDAGIFIRMLEKALKNENL